MTIDASFSRHPPERSHRRDHRDLPVADRLTRRNVKVAPDAISEGNSIGPLKKLLTRPTEATLP